MRIEQLEYLIDISKTHSMNKTAKNFYITQQGISDTIKKLEQEFNVTLLERNQQGTFLTSFGELFVKKGAEILAIYRELLLAVDTYTNNQLVNYDSTMTVMAHPRFYRNIIPDIIPIFHQHCPKVKLRIVEQLNDEILNSINTKQVDLGLACMTDETIDKLTTKSSKIKLEILFKDNYVVCAKKDSKFAQVKKYTFSSLAQLPIVTYDFKQSMEQNAILGTDNPLFLATNDTSLHYKLLSQGIAIDVMTQFEYNKQYSNDTNLCSIPIYNDKLNFVIISPDIKSERLDINYFNTLLHQYSF